MSTIAQGQEEENPPLKPWVSVTLSPETIEYLRAWMMSPEHMQHPYPNDQEKAKIMVDTGITSKQLTCWFSNNRKRFWKPKMELMGRHDLVEAAMGTSLSPHVIEYLKAWIMSPEHIENPYPTEEDKVEIMAATGIDKKQLTCWFSNNRKRFWKPKMDQLRTQFGLSQSDPLPAALLATAAAPDHSPNEINRGTELGSRLNVPELPLGFKTSPSGTLDTSYAPVAALQFGISTESFVEPVAGSIDNREGENTTNNNKRQKLSSDNFVAV